MSSTLVAQVKRKLNITWNDADTDRRVTDIIEQAMSVMSHKLGITDDAFDYEQKSVANVLFLAYCLYLYNHCENEFDENYRELIMQARAIYEVEQGEID